MNPESIDYRLNGRIAGAFCIVPLANGEVEMLWCLVLNDEAKALNCRPGRI
jgi:hypothetical protein